MDNLIQIAAEITDPVERLRFWQGRTVEDQLAATFDLSMRAYGIEKNSTGNWPEMNKHVIRFDPPA
jgi:hypothetical protein